MGPDGNGTSSSSSSPSATATVKRGRDLEDEVYVDNLHSHKRYLSEIMASSLNGLTVGESLSENLMDSPVRSESMMSGLRDELSVQYSPMSEDSDDLRYHESPTRNTCSSQPESAPTSPVSPHRGQKPLSAYIASSSTTYPCATSSAMSPLPRQRGSDNEARFPSSPSDICHTADLRKAALLRSVQMRAQPAGPAQFEVDEPSMNVKGDESGGG
ncbi:hypothetical protein STAS_21233 [Striga asiatica]|uniref:Uncharacterized protein n=1 Tax=Striga asiatica TaxID=4170 RepID=A0A5A7QH05_STRAF|nr:hypothetical protein STAS_21233 [Striga asiatica]